MLEKILQIILYFFARAILKKYQPEIIGITGSAGKTSARDAIGAVLSAKFSVRKNFKNYNNEIGLPLTIIGRNSGGRSPLRWLAIFLAAVKLLIIKDKAYPRILVLEMGADRIGDLIYLTALAPPKIGVITSIGPAHLEFFKTLEKIAEEKSILIKCLPASGWAVLNHDDFRVSGLKNLTSAQVLTYGLNAGADLSAGEINLSRGRGQQPAGLSFKLTYAGSTVPVFIPNILGEHSVYAVLAGAAVGLVYNLNLLEVAEALKNFESPPGRMRLIDGLNSSFIIDDSYNASPQSTLAAVKTLGSININAGGKKYALLGDMLELGDYTEKGHRQVGAAMAENKIDYLIAVGERANFIVEAAKQAGLNSERIFHFASAIEAGEFLRDKLKAGDVVLVKGSQGMRLEKAIKEIMAEPLRAKELLVRQDEAWLKK